MLQSIEKKEILFDLNLDYQIKGLNVETQTNILINKYINDFYNKFKDTFENKVFIYEYNDDLISLIGYNILLIVKSIEPKFNFYLYGNKKRTRKYLKSQKFYSYNQIKKNKDNIILISSFNPIYKVGKFFKSSKVFSFNKKDIRTLIKPSFELMRQFTPDELFTAQKFYGIGYIKNYKKLNNIDIKDNKVIDFNKYLYNNNTDLNNCFLDVVPPQQNIGNLQSSAPRHIIAVYVTPDIEQTNNYLQYIEQSDKIVLYYGKWNKLLDDNNFKFLVKYTSNRPLYTEFNNTTLLKSFIENNYDIEFLGDWPITLKEDLLNAN